MGTKSMRKRLVDYIEEGVMPITLWSHHDWFVTVEAKIDTGADRSSVDIGIIEALEFEPTGKSGSVRSANGVRTRKLYRVSLQSGGGHQEIIATAADRSNMRYPMIIGHEDFLNLCEIEEEE